MTPNWSMREHENLDGTTSRLADDVNPIKRKVQSMSFMKYTSRKDISEGAYSANEERFNNAHGSVFDGQINKPSVNIERYASRGANSAAGKPFEVPCSGLFYDVG